jgi:hypothetical protein
MKIPLRVYFIASFHPVAKNLRVAVQCRNEGGERWGEFRKYVDLIGGSAAASTVGIPVKAGRLSVWALVGLPIAFSLILSFLVRYRPSDLRCVGFVRVVPY